jgi:hypothetical protein
MDHGRMCGMACAVWIGLAGPAFGQELVTSLPSTTDDKSIALSAGRLAVGDTVGLPERVTLYELDGASWVPFKTLVSPIAGQNDTNFGRDLAFGDGFLVVGGPRLFSVEENAGGAAHVFRPQGPSYVHEATVYPSTFVSGLEFGRQVRASGDRILVGNQPFIEAPVHVFRRDGGAWPLESTLEDPGTHGFFGHSVAFADPWAFVGTKLGASGLDTGAVHVYRRDGTSWSLVQTLEGSDFGVGSGFGGHMAADGTRLVAGTTSSFPRRVQLFSEAGGSWQLDQTFVAPQHFGASETSILRTVDVDGDQVVIATNTRVESLVVCDGAWTRGFRFDAPFLGLASTIEVQQDMVGVHAYGAGITVLVDPDADAGYASIPGGIASAHGVPLLTWHGLLCAGAPHRVELTGARPDAPALVFLGAHQAGQPYFGGTLVTDAEFVVEGLVTDGLGTLSVDVGWPPSVASGLELVVQAWVDDATAPLGAAGSNGVLTTTP